MASVVIEGFNGTTPLREDGTRWPFILVLGDMAIVADHNADLINALDANYMKAPQKDAHSALLARGALALSLAAIRQAQLLDQHFAAYGEGTVTEDELDVILAPRSEPLTMGGAWGHPVQLIGIATDFAPYTALPAPIGNIVLIDPYTDTTLLRSLDDAGVLVYRVHQDA
jgi:hypothetical protein